MAVLGTLAAYWPASSWPVTFACCSGGFTNIHYAVAEGYGMCMVANAGLTLAVAKYHYRAPLTPFGLACTGLYAAYGVRLTSYLCRRSQEDGYAPVFHRVQLRTDVMGFGEKLAHVAGVSLAQALYTLPLAVATRPSAASARPALRAMGWAGVGISAAGLLLEGLADEQKLVAKRANPAEPVMDGLYSYCRHPNYLGEFIFHCGISCMGLLGTPIQVFACVCPTFFMYFTLQNSARRTEKQADHKYQNNPKYKDWKATTPSILPTLGGVSQPTANQA